MVRCYAQTRDGDEAMLRCYVAMLRCDVQKRDGDEAMLRCYVAMLRCDVQKRDGDEAMLRCYVAMLRCDVQKRDGDGAMLRCYALFDHSIVTSLHRHRVSVSTRNESWEFDAFMPARMLRIRRWFFEHV